MNAHHLKVSDFSALVPGHWLSELLSTMPRVPMRPQATAAVARNLSAASIGLMAILSLSLPGLACERHLQGHQGMQSNGGSEQPASQR